MEMNEISPFATGNTLLCRWKLEHVNLITVRIVFCLDNLEEMIPRYTDSRLCITIDFKESVIEIKG